MPISFPATSHVLAHMNIARADTNVKKKKKNTIKGQKRDTMVPVFYFLDIFNKMIQNSHYKMISDTLERVSFARK